MILVFLSQKIEQKKYCGGFEGIEYPRGFVAGASKRKGRPK